MGFGATLLLAVALIIPASTSATEKKIQRSDLPADVQKTVNVESRGATVRGFSQETEGGNTYYEVEMIVSSHHKDVLIDSKGIVVEIEEEVALSDLPAAVRTGIETKAAGATLQRVESLTKRGRLVAYEAHILHHGKKLEIQVGTDGQPLTHEE